MKRMKLIGVSEPFVGDSFPLDEKEVILGSDPAVAHIILSPDLVAPSHCKLISADNGAIMIEDLGSEHGTYIYSSTGRKKVTEPVLLQEGEKISIGDDRFIFEIGSETVKETSARFCTKCGNRINGAGRFCTACGASINAGIPNIRPQARSSSAPITAVNPRSSGSSLHPLALPAMFAALGVTLGLPLSYYFQPPMIRKIPLSDYIEGIPKMLIGAIAQNEDYRMATAVAGGDLGATIIMVCVVCALIGGVIGYFVEKRRNAARFN
jgi:hypothetical protein